ncbi:hypothetical protein ABT270_25750 [Streptomyces sp900105245]|uniref:hypothetical protein n=1 Tax=Streptomyces sp. 900105245 TaxID=3154379 RepID=UPI003332036F
MQSSQRAGVSEREAARRVIVEALPEFWGRVADRMEHQANATPQVPYDFRDWLNIMHGILNWLPGDYEEKRAREAHYRDSVRDKTGGEILYRVVLPSEYWNGAYPGAVPRDRWQERLRELREALTAVADLLRRLSPPPLPHHRPPAFALLRKSAVAVSVADQLTALVTEGRRHHEAALGGFPASSAIDWYERSRAVLGHFRTTEVPQRFVEATEGLEKMELLARARRRFPQQYDSGALSPLLHRAHAAYVAVALDYLAEVLERMPDYTEASGQGKRRDPVTVYGNVGAIGDVHNSHIAVADTVISIGASINAVAARGEPDVAAALRDLTQAVQRAPGLAEDRRAQLLDGVADVADAVVAPDEPRRLSRARNAMAAIASAAGTSSQLAHAVETWHQVAGHLF